MDPQWIVWIKSGGRCAICNRYLLDDNFGTVVPVGENAHIVGRSAAAGSPRGNDPLPVAVRDNPENLVLLCREQHRLIDNPSLTRLFTVEELLDIKRTHEARIHHVTGLEEKRYTAILRLIGKVRGDSPSVPRGSAAAATIEFASRYPFYPLSLNNDGVEIDLQNFSDEGSETYYAAAKAKISEEVSKLNEGIRRGSVNHVSVFAFARIPLLIFLGKIIDDTIPTDLYQFMRSTQNWKWIPSAPIVRFVHAMTRTGSTSDEAILVVNASGTIKESELPSELATLPVFIIQPTCGIIPQPDTIQNNCSLVNFEKTFREFLSFIESSHKSIRRLHLFSAVPLSVAVCIGRCISRDVAPNFSLYELIDSRRICTMRLDK